MRNRLIPVVIRRSQTLQAFNTIFKTLEIQLKGKTLVTLLFGQRRIRDENEVHNMV